MLESLRLDRTATSTHDRYATDIFVIISKIIESEVIFSHVPSECVGLSQNAASAAAPMLDGRGSGGCGTQCDCECKRGA